MAISSSICWEKASNLAQIPFITHGFFGRHGGVSTGDFESLNCSYHVGSLKSDPFLPGDPLKNVVENRRRILSVLGMPQTSLVLLNQVHGACVHVVKESFSLVGFGRLLNGDGMVTQTPGVALGILGADCAPVFFVDPVLKIIGACHAGSKGALSGILESMCSTFKSMGSTVESLQVAVGPVISRESYEVDPPFYETFMSEDPNCRDFFYPGLRPEYYQFDLPGFIFYKLRHKFGIDQVVSLDLDTVQGPFFSRRRALLSGYAQYGCGLSAIMIR